MTFSANANDEPGFGEQASLLPSALPSAPENVKTATITTGLNADLDAGADASPGAELDAEWPARESKLEQLQLKELLAQAPAMIGLLDGPEHRWTFVNTRMVQLTGRSSADDFLGKSFDRSLPEMETQPFRDLLDKVFLTGEPFTGSEVQARLNRAAQGLPEEGYFDFVFQPVKTALGNVASILIHAVEVTDKVTARQTLEQNTMRLTLAQTAAQIGTWEWDPESGMQSLSPELHRIFGTEASDPDRVQVWSSRVHKQDWPKVRELMEESARTGQMEFEYRYEHPETGLRWLYCKGGRSADEKRMFGIVQDITVRKAADLALQRLAAIVESSEDAIVSKDLNGIVTSWNPGAEKMFGYTAEEMVGRPITTIIPPELHDDEARILATIARGEGIEHFETVRLRKDGETLPVSITVSPVKDQTGRIVGAAKIARDITQQKRTEQTLMTSERLAAVGRLAATVAHEINNPLEAVTNLIYLAKMATTLSKVRGFLASAEEQMASVSQLTRQTLGFYRETSGARLVQPGQIVASLKTIFTARARNKDIQLSEEINSSAEITAVPGEIRQVFANLVSNSIDAIHGPGKIRIRVSSTRNWSDGLGSGIRITVADTGMGIPVDVRSRVFEPFFTTKRDVGTGLGLWVCKSIVDNHRGTIRIRSATTPGKSWTAVSVFLPLNAKTQSANEPAPEAAPDAVSGLAAI